MSVRSPELGGDWLPGNVPIDTAARVAALDCLLDDIGASLPRGNADMLIDYVAWRYERGEIEGARRSLMHGADVDLTAAYRIETVLHTEGVR